MDTKRIQVVHEMDTQDRLGKGRLGQDTNTDIQPIEQSKYLDTWQEQTNVKIRSDIPENIRAATWLEKEVGADRLEELIKATRVIKADNYQPRRLQKALTNFIGLKNNLAEVESYIQARIDKPSFDMSTRKRIVSI